MKLKFDKLFAILCLLMVVILYVNTGNIKNLASASDPGARLFPYIGEALLAICSICVLLSKSDVKSGFQKKEWLKLLLVVGCMILYALALKWLGFLISTPVAIIIFIFILKSEEKVKPVVAVVLAITVTVGLYYLFTKGFSILLPQGKVF